MEGRKTPILFLAILLAAPAGSAATRAMVGTVVGADPDAVIAAFDDDNADIGVAVYSFTRRRFVYEYDSRRPLNPASAMKLVTSLACLETFGPDYTFATFLTTDKFSGGLARNIYVKGAGDPSLTKERLEHAAERLARLGVKVVQGDIVVDGSYFLPDPPLAPGLRGSMIANAALVLNPYTAALNLMYGGGEILSAGNRERTALSGDRRGGRRSSPKVSATRAKTAPPGRSKGRAVPAKPELAAGEALREAIETSGIKFSGAVREGDADAGAVVLAQEESEPLSTLLLPVNKRSNNFMAEMLLKDLSARVLGPPGSMRKGAAVLADVLDRLGIPPGEFHAANGSGLSRDNRLSANALARVLIAAAERPNVRGPFLKSLSIAGADGTLKKRMRDSSLAGNVRAKTGTLRDAQALAGYLRAKSGKILAFAILVHNPAGAGRRYHEMQERLLQFFYDTY